MTEPMRVTAEVEKCARAIYEKRNGGGAMAWRHRDAKHKAPYYADALACMEALLEPTIEMQNAAHAGEDEVGAYRAMLLRAMGR